MAKAKGRRTLGLLESEEEHPFPVAGGIEPVRHARVRVRDFGPGISADQLERVFEPFYRLGQKLTRTVEGTGIGLALVRELAKGMGGMVRAKNPPDGGLEIIVTVVPADD